MRSDGVKLRDKKQTLVDFAKKEQLSACFLDWEQISQNQKKSQSLLASRGKITSQFFTEDSKLYITRKEMKLLSRGFQIRHSGRFDSLTLKYQKADDWKERKYILEARIRRSVEEIKDIVRNASDLAMSAVPESRVWKLSMASAVMVGMVSMSLIYEYMGQSASAEREMSSRAIVRPALVETGQVLGEAQMMKEREENSTMKLFKKIDEEKVEKTELEKEIREMVKGYPIEKMIPDIMQKDKKVAAFMVSIAKKESNWGKRVPVLNGQDCYNYWGYRGVRKYMGTAGHTCFNSRKDAVDTIAKRLDSLIKEEKKDTPEKLIVWKCGFSCESHSPESVEKWISDVDKYYKKLSR